MKEPKENPTLSYRKKRKRRAKFYGEENVPKKTKKELEKSS